MRSRPPSRTSRCSCGATRSPSTGPDAERVAALFEDLIVLVEQGHALDAVDRAPQRRDGPPGRAAVRGPDLRGAAPGPGRPVRPKSSGQKRYVDAVRDNVITFAPRPRRHRQELAGRRDGRAGAAGQAGRPHHPHPAPPSRRGSGSGSSPGTSWPRSTRTCARSGTRSTTWSAPRPAPSSSSGAPSRSRPSRSCAGATAGRPASPHARRVAPHRGPRSGRPGGRLRWSADHRAGCLPAGSAAGVRPAYPGRRRRRECCAEHLWSVHDDRRSPPEGGTRRAGPTR